MSNDPEYTTTNPRTVERAAWLAVILALVAVPFAGLVLDAPWYWYVYATAYTAATSEIVRRA